MVYIQWLTFLPICVKLTGSPIASGAINGLCWYWLLCRQTHFSWEKMAALRPQNVVHGLRVILRMEVYLDWIGHRGSWFFLLARRKGGFRAFYKPANDKKTYYCRCRNKRRGANLTGSNGPASCPGPVCQMCKNCPMFNVWDARTCHNVDIGHRVFFNPKKHTAVYWQEGGRDIPHLSLYSFRIFFYWKRLT